MSAKNAAAKAKMAAMMKKQKEARIKRQQEEKEKKAREAARQGKSGSASFQVPILDGSASHPLRKYFESNDTVKTLKQAVVDEEQGGKIEDLTLYYGGEALKDELTLGYYGIDGTKPVAIWFKVHGGSTNNDEKDEKEKEERERMPDWDNTNISPSLEPDCIMGFDEDDVLRVEMPCGHVFDPITIYNYIESCMDNLFIDVICCPILDCKNAWKHSDIISAADLNKNEQSKLIGVMETRALIKCGKLKQCSACNSFMKKPDELYMLRVRCSSEKCRKRGDICWICAQPWKGGGFAVCGNENCITADINKKLATCGTTIKVLGREGVHCPKIRACPRCLALVGYKEACKHMKCWHCKEYFCFICLALGHKKAGRDSVEKWDCKIGGNSHSGECDVHDVQKIK